MNIDWVLCIPLFMCSLLSVSRLTKEINCDVTLFSDFCIAEGLEARSFIGVGKCKVGLYRMDFVTKKRNDMLVVPDVGVWHKRFGHALESMLRQVEFLRNYTFCINK